MEIFGMTNNLSITPQTGLSEVKNQESFQDALDSAMESQNKEQLKKACVEFESYFLSLMFKEMRSSVNSSDGILPKSRAEEIFQSMLDDETAKSVAGSTKSIGLADMLYKQMEKNL